MDVEPENNMTKSDTRVAELRAAQLKAERLFHEIEARSLIHAGITETQLNDEIYALAKECTA